MYLHPSDDLSSVMGRQKKWGSGSVMMGRGSVSRFGPSSVIFGQMRIILNVETETGSPSPQQPEINLPPNSIQIYANFISGAASRINDILRTETNNKN